MLKLLRKFIYLRIATGRISFLPDEAGFIPAFEIDLNDVPVVEVVPIYCFTIFLLSSWANAKVISTMINKTTTRFLSDKIALICGK